RRRGHLRPYRQGGRGGTPEFLTTDEQDSFFLSFSFSFLSFDPEKKATRRNLAAVEEEGKWATRAVIHRESCLGVPAVTNR
ncbi:unnamed protein product, partial [Musa textilis]